MFWGKLASINLYACNPKSIKSKKKISDYIVELCDLIDMKRFGKSIIQRFAEGDLEGYSAMQFIETSSITLHFDETQNRAFIDIFSCKDFNAKEVERFSKKFFGAKKSKAKVTIRK